MDNLNHGKLMMQYSFHGLSDPGLVRTNNEDSLAFDEVCGLVVLADGMGVQRR